MSIIFNRIRYAICKRFFPNRIGGITLSNRNVGGITLSK